MFIYVYVYMYIYKCIIIFIHLCIYFYTKMHSIDTYILMCIRDKRVFVFVCA